MQKGDGGEGVHANVSVKRSNLTQNVEEVKGNGEEVLSKEEVDGH